MIKIDNRKFNYKDYLIINSPFAINILLLLFVVVL